MQNPRHNMCPILLLRAIILIFCIAFKHCVKEVVFSLVVRRPIIATHYNLTSNDPHLKLEQSKCNAAVHTKYLLATPSKIVHNTSGVATPSLKTTALKDVRAVKGQG